MQTLNGEDWPPLMKDAPVEMIYIGPVPDEAKYALGHSFFGNLPGLFMFATVWMREHNRVCDILKKVHPDWDDERLFQTTKLVTLGKTKKNKTLITLGVSIRFLAWSYSYIFLGSVLLLNFT